MSSEVGSVAGFAAERSSAPFLRSPAYLRNSCPGDLLFGKTTRPSDPRTTLALSLRQLGRHQPKTTNLTTLQRSPLQRNNSRTATCITTRLRLLTVWSLAVSTIGNICIVIVVFVALLSSLFLALDVVESRRLGEKLLCL